MGVLILVRHGQASFMHDDYDQLSALGVQQGRWLGEYWVKAGMTFDAAYIGPRHRHRQTHDAVASVYRSYGLFWPEPQFLPELDEHHGWQVMEQVVPTLAEQDPAIHALAASATGGGVPAQRASLRLYEAVSRLWVQGAVEAAGLESWAEFCARVNTSLVRMTAADGRARHVAAFTSGGVVASAVGGVLGLNGEKMLELSWLVRNTSFTELLFSADRLSLRMFNAVAHLVGDDSLTYI